MNDDEADGTRDAIRRGAPLDFAIMGAIGGLYMAFMLACVWAPEWLGSRTAFTGPLSVGLVLGLGLVVIIVFSAIGYDMLRRRQEKDVKRASEPGA
ncbi:DUF485 domain-containing protein [Hyphomonas johnsonii]|uniref:DUF485 domain-containing protein n=1 Tax=Hyphomonas johnsonii MHS-2 TaxID=1280950 RepID=A0A059FBB4_9PROT|nr:DUF485 domain-containing protein [Hyphomonas johnsonii]KCZ87904.1 hypothetical protein HJO_16010 [Hyphomonas johnsonii MHS-2]